MGGSNPIKPCKETRSCQQPNTRTVKRTIGDSSSNIDYKVKNLIRQSTVGVADETPRSKFSMKRRKNRRSSALSTPDSSRKSTLNLSTSDTFSETLVADGASSLQTLDAPSKVGITIADLKSDVFSRSFLRGGVIAKDEVIPWNSAVVSW